MASKKTAKKTAAKKTTKKKSSTGGLAVGAGVAAAVAAAGAAGYYFYGAKNAQKHRSAAKKWAKDLKKDVIREAKKMKDLDEKALALIVDQAAKAYKGLGEVTPEDLRTAVSELKGSWAQVRKEVRGTGRAAKKTVQKAVKKAAPKKTAKK